MYKAVGLGNFGPGILGFLTDNASSIYIPNGMSVQVNDRAGRRQTFTSSVPNLAQYGWDNRVNSGFIQSAGNGGGALPPQGNRVIFYRDMKYTGEAKEYNQGNFSVTSQHISSIYIPAGWSVQVNDRSGGKRTFTTSVSNLAQYGWDNRIYSGFISAGNSNGGSQGGNTGNAVILYRDPNYGGNATPCAQGAIGNVGAGTDNNISSIKVPPGYSVTVFDGLNFNGASRTFTNSVPNLAPYGRNDKISSVVVSKL